MTALTGAGNVRNMKENTRRNLKTPSVVIAHAMRAELTDTVMTLIVAIMIDNLNGADVKGVTVKAATTALKAQD